MLVATEGLHVTNIHSLVILVLAYYYACKISGKDFKDVLNISDAAETLAKIFDTIIFRVMRQQNYK